MVATKHGAQETAKDAFKKHLLVRVYSNLSTLVPPLFPAGVNLQAVRFLYRAVLVNAEATSTRNFRM
jgi:hypothetical protein